MICQPISKTCSSSEGSFG